VGLRAVLYAVLKRKFSSSRRESNSRIPIIQSVAQRYTVLFDLCIKEMPSDDTAADTDGIIR
jgi:hypothetical protein